MSWEDRPSFRMDLGRIWDWERQRLTVDFDIRPTSGLRRPDQEEDEPPPPPVEETQQASPSNLPPTQGLDPKLSTESRNLNKQFLLRGRHVPFKARLDQALGRVLDGGEGGNPAVHESASVRALGMGSPAAAVKGASPADTAFRSRRKLSAGPDAAAAAAAATASAGHGELSESARTALAGLQYQGDLFAARGPYLDGMLYRSRGRKLPSLHRPGGAHGSPAGSTPGTPVGAPEPLPPTAGEVRSVVDVLASSTAPGAGAGAAAVDNSAPGEPTGDPTLRPRTSKHSVDVWKERCAETLANWATGPAGAGSDWDDTPPVDPAARAACRAQRLLMVREGTLEALVTMSKLHPTTPRLQHAVVHTMLRLAGEIDITKQLVQMDAHAALAQLCAPALAKGGGGKRSSADAGGELDAEEHSLLSNALLCICVFTRLRSPRKGDAPDERATLADTESRLALQQQQGRGVAARVSCVSLLQKAAHLSPALMSLALRALFNLTVVSHAYDGIDRVMRAVTALGCISSSMPLGDKQVLAAALANLSHVLAWRELPQRMVDEPVVDAVGHLSRRSDVFTKQVICVVLANLAEYTPADLMNKGGGQLVIHLAEEAATQVFGPPGHAGECDDNPALMERQHWAAVALFRLVQARACRVPAVRQGIVSALNKISAVADRFGHEWDGTVQLVAQALLLLASDDATKQPIMDKGCVPVLIRMAKSRNEQTREACTLALCALLSLSGSVVYIMQQGAVGALVQLSKAENEDTRFWCASVIFNLSGEGETAALLVREGFVPAMLNLIEAKRSTTIELVTATLANLATDAGNRERLAAEGVLLPVMQVMARVYASLARLRQQGEQQQDDLRVAADTVGHCAKTLAANSWAERGLEELLHEDLLEPVMLAMRWADVDIGVRRYMSVTLTNMFSVTDMVCTLAFGRHEGLQAVIDFASVDDADVRRRCAVMLCQISCNPNADRLRMAQAGCIPLLAHLSDSAPHAEEQQLYCARALSNIATDSDAARAMIEGGSAAGCEEEASGVSLENGGPLRFTFEGASSNNVVQFLMMVSLVRASAMETKMACTKALLSMLTAETLGTLLDQGLIQLLTSLAYMPTESGSEQSLECCAQGFEILVTNDRGRESVCSNRRALLSLFGRPNPSVSIGSRSSAHSGANGVDAAATNEEGEEKSSTKGGGIIFRASGSKTLLMLARSIVQLLLDETCYRRLLNADVVETLQPLTTRGPVESHCDTATAMFLLATYEDGRRKLLETTPLAPVQGKVGARECLPLRCLLTLLRENNGGARLAAARALSTLAFYPQCRVPLLRAYTFDGVDLLETMCDAEHGLVCGRQTAGGGAVGQFNTHVQACAVGGGGETEELREEVELLCRYLSTLESLSFVLGSKNRSRMIHVGAVAALHAIFDALAMVGGTGARVQCLVMERFGGWSEIVRRISRTLQCLSWAGTMDSLAQRRRSVIDTPVSSSEASDDVIATDAPSPADDAPPPAQPMPEKRKTNWQELQQRRLVAVVFEKESRRLESDRAVLLQAMVDEPSSSIVELLVKVTRAEFEHGSAPRDDTLSDVAAVFCCLSLEDSLRVKLVEHGALEALVAMAQVSAADVLWRVAAAMHYLLRDTANVKPMVEYGCVRALLTLAVERTSDDDKLELQAQWRLRPGTKPETVHECAAALCGMTYYADACDRIVADGAVVLLAKLAEESASLDRDPNRVAKTRSFCTVAFSNVSHATAAVDRGLVAAFVQMMGLGVHQQTPALMGERGSILDMPPEVSCVPPNLMRESEVKVTETDVALGADVAFEQLRPSDQWTGDDAAEQLWEQLEKDKKAMAQPMGASPGAEGGVIVLPARPLGASFTRSSNEPGSSGSDAATVNLLPPRFGKAMQLGHLGNATARPSVPGSPGSGPEEDVAIELLREDALHAQE